MKRKFSFISLTILLSLIISMVLPSAAWAEGTEQLGPPEISIPSSASGIAFSGATPHADGPTDVSTTVPAGATITKALIYWYVALPDNAPSNQIIVEGTTVVGTQIGGSTQFFATGGEGIYFTGFRADITQRGWILPGTTELTIDIPFNTDEEAVGLVVIYNNELRQKELQLLDGLDLAFFGFASPLNETKTRTYTFEAAPEDRPAELSLWIGSLATQDGNGQVEDRPYDVLVNVGNGPYSVLPTPKVSTLGYGLWWEARTFDVVVPAEMTKLTVEVVSTTSSDPLGASLAWEGTALLLPKIEPGSIIVKKVTEPRDAEQAFDFTTSYGPSFPLMDGQSNDSGNLAPGTYTVAETVPADWELISATCDDGSAPSSIDLAAGETVICTFTNRMPGKIIVKKVTEPRDAEQAFDFTTSYGPSFPLMDGQSNDSGNLAPGTYTVAETVPADWELISATCDDGSAPSSIDLAAGETVICTFTNRMLGKIIVKKVTEPRGAEQAFDFTTSYGPSFPLMDGQSNDSGDLAPGTYTVAETVPADWELISATCDDGSAPSSIDLAAGETVICTFTNRMPGKIIVKKVTEPRDAEQAFDFTTSYGPSFQLMDGQSNDSGDLVPGTYTVAETVPAGWALISAACDDGSAPSSIDLAAGEMVVCTFTNRMPGKIIVKKVTEPRDAEQAFDFTTSYGPSFPLMDGQSNDSGDLVPGTYTVAETVPAGWALISAACDDGSAPSSIDLAAGEMVVCTFTNRMPGKIIVKKVTEPKDAEQAFDFTTSYGPSFPLMDGQSNDSGDLAPGTYTVAETVPADWELISATCDDGSAPSSIDLAAGEMVVCTFTNRMPGKIIVKKVTEPRDAEQAFDFTTSYGPSFQLMDGQSNDSGDLDPADSYAVTEAVSSGWIFVDSECKLEDGTLTGAGTGTPNITDIEVEPGMTTTCTFTNELILVSAGRTSTIAWSYLVTNRGPSDVTIKGVFAAPGVTLDCTPAIGTTLEDGASMTCNAQSESRIDCRSPAWVYAETDTARPQPLFSWLEAESCTVP